MNLQLNLSTSPQPNNRPFVAYSALLGIVGVVALAVLSVAAFRAWHSNRTLHQDINRWTTAIENDQARQRSLANEFRTPNDQQVLGRSAFLNSLIDERSFPWTRIFADLEEALPAGVRVVNISPKLVNGRAEVLLTVGAATDEQKIHFLEAIEKSKDFSEMQVVSERHTEQGSTADKIIVDLKVVYAIT